MSLLKDRKGTLLILSFLVVDALLFYAAMNWLGWRAPLPTEVKALMPADESALIGRLERAAVTRSWSDVEDARQSALAELRATRRMPARGVRLYFFPELIGNDSLEADISKEEIRPALEALRATRGGAPRVRERAAEVLRSRVENYELGATTDEEQLSSEASRFLGIYEKLTR